MKNYKKRINYSKDDEFFLLNEAKKYNYKPNYKESEIIAKKFEKRTGKKVSGGSIYMKIYRLRKGLDQKRFPYYI